MSSQKRFLKSLATAEAIDAAIRTASAQQMLACFDENNANYIDLKKHEVLYRAQIKEKHCYWLQNNLMLQVEAALTAYARVKRAWRLYLARAVRNLRYPRPPGPIAGWML